MRWLWYTFLTLFSLGMLGIIVAVAGTVYVISSFGRDLPDYSQLKTYAPAVVTRVYAGDGRLMSEFAQEKRVFVPIEVIPPIVKQAFISAEDKNFYSHQGVDYFAVARAMVSNLQNMGSGRRPEGASTITQQVAKNFLLTNEVSYKRKIREAILAFRMERAMNKQKLLELYLNEIYLGEGTYGVAAAALSYFDKSLEELSIDEAAFLAALPKAPNNYHPVRRHSEGLARRNWVIDRMLDDGHITAGQAELAKARPLQMNKGDLTDIIRAPYYAEEVRRVLIDTYGEASLYKGGLVVRTSINPRLQRIATKALRAGLVEYDRRHGYRGPVTHFNNMEDWPARIAAINVPGRPPEWQMAIVLETTPQKAVIGFSDKMRGELQLEHLTWARKALRHGAVGPVVNSVRDVLKPGDVIMTDQVTLSSGETVYGLRQVPRINGALVAMDPHTGRVLAMEGGWSYEQSEFNRATQAWRQPGSAFKPYVYLAALEQDFTPATLVLDAPLAIDQGPGLRKWRPTNYSGEFYGPTPIRVGVEKSRNLMTVRLADYVGMDNIIDLAKKYGVIVNMRPNLANSLGAGETTLMRLTTGYAQFVNGGKKIDPSLIDRIQGRRGETIYRHDGRDCTHCGTLVEWRDQPVPAVPDTREQLTDPRRAYQVVSILEGAVQRGTAQRLRSLNHPLAGKTGTTNAARDTWFIGFTPDLVVGVFVGFDDPEPMGRRETGSSVAVPIFKDFMEEALDGVPPMPFRIPPGIRQVQINAETGTRARPGDKSVIWEAFVPGTEPTDKMYILDGNGISLMPSMDTVITETPLTGTGGIY